jgi:hypothetical protein
MKDLKDFFRIFWGEIVFMTLIAIAVCFIVIKK